MTQLLNVKQAAALLNVSAALVYSMAERGELPHVRLRARILFSEPVLEAWVTEQLQKVGR